MNCKKCGNILNQNEILCRICGEKVNIEPTINTNIHSEYVQSTGMNHVTNDAQQINNNNVYLTNNQSTISQLNQNINNNQMNSNFRTTQQATPYIQPQTTNPVKRKSPFIIIVVVLFIIIAVLVVILLSKNFNNKNTNTPSINNSNNPQTSDSINNENTNTNTNTNVIEYNNFAFPIPDKYTAELNNGIIKFVNVSDKIIVGENVISGYTVMDIENELDDIKTSLSESGFNITTTETKTFAGRNHIVLSGTMEQDGQTMNTVVAYSGLGSYHIVQALIYNVGNSVSNDSIIETFANVYKNTTYNGSYEFSETEEKSEIPTDKINELTLSVLE